MIMLERVQSIIAKFTEAEEITPESALAADLGLSSFDLVSIVAEFEDEFDLEVPDRDIPGFVTVGDILRYIEERS
jgi:acyl carrier protein